MFAMFLTLNRKLRMIKKYNVSARPAVPVFILMAVVAIAIGLIPPAVHAGSVGLVNVKLSPPILIKAAKVSEPNSNSAWNFEDNLSRGRAGHSTEQGRIKSKYYYAVRTPAAVDYNQNQKRPQEEMKMEGMEAQSLLYGVDLPDFEEAQQQYFEYLPEVRDQPTNYEASYDRGTNNKRFQYDEERAGESSHPYYGMREEKEFAKPIPQRPLPSYPQSAAGAGSKFSYGQEELVDYADLPPPVISHPLPERAGPSPINDYRSQVSSRLRQLPVAQQSSSSVFRPSQADNLYETITSPNIIPPNNEQIVGNSQSTTTTTPTKNKYPTFHQQIVVNINNHREVQPTDSSLPLQPQQDNVLPSSRPPNEQLSIDNYSVVQRPPNQFIPNPGPGTTNSNFNSRPSLTVQQQYGQSLTPQVQNSGLRLPQSNYGPSRFQSDTRLPMAMAPNRNMFNMNNNNGARYSHIYRRSPSAPQAQVPTQTAWRPIRSPSNVRHGRFRRSTAPYVSIMDNSFPQSFSMPILSAAYIQNRKNVTNQAIPSYAVVDSEFITVRDFSGTDSDFDLLLRKSSAQLQDADLDEDEIASADLSSINFSEIRNWTVMNFVDKNVPSPSPLSAHVNNKVPVIPVPADNNAKLLNQSSFSSLAFTGKNPSFIPLINFSHVIKPNGDYNVDFVTGHGISANEMGYRQAEVANKEPAFIDVEKSGKGQGKGDSSSEEGDSQEKLSNVKLGSISWTSPEGVEFHLSYKADENGYRPTISQTYSSHPGSTNSRRKTQDEIQQK